MKEFQFVPKMKIELTGEVREDRGRIIIHRPGRISLLSRGWGRPWSREWALVSVKTATLFQEQPDQCLSCPWGSLADVLDRQYEDEKRRRNLYCLKGIVDPRDCYVRASLKRKKRKPISK